MSVKPMAHPSHGWQMRRLGDCARLINGRAYSQDELLDAGTPVIRIQNLNGGDRWYYSDLSLPDEKYCNAGDLLFAWSASFGPYIWSGPRSIFHYHIWRVVPNETLDQQFAFHLLEWITERVKAASRGVAMLHMTKAGMENWEVPLPPLPEQRRIAAILDKADTLRTQRRAALAQLDNLTQSLFLDMFGDPAINPNGWPLVRLDQLIRSDDSINYGVVQPGDALEEGVPLVRVGDIVDGNLHAQALKRIDPKVESAYKRSRLKGDEVLVTCVGSIGVVALASPDMKDFNIARAVARVPLSDRVDRSFIASYLRTDHVQRYFTAELRTVSQPTLNIKQICETKVIQPPLPLQRTFATRVQAIEALKAQHRAALAEADALFAALQQRAFAGDL